MKYVIEIDDAPIREAADAGKPSAPISTAAIAAATRDLFAIAATLGVNLTKTFEQIYERDDEIGTLGDTTPYDPNNLPFLVPRDDTRGYWFTIVEVDF